MFFEYLQQNYSPVFIVQYSTEFGFSSKQPEKLGVVLLIEQWTTIIHIKLFSMEYVKLKLHFQHLCVKKGQHVVYSKFSFLLLANSKLCMLIPKIRALFTSGIFCILTGQKKCLCIEKRRSCRNTGNPKNSTCVIKGKECTT